MTEERMLEPRTWEEFRATRLLWWVNRTLHLFGWAIVLEVEEDGTVQRAYPARCKFRGFHREAEDDGFVGLSEYLTRNAETLAAEAREE